LFLKRNVVVGGSEVGIRVRRRGCGYELPLAAAAFAVAAAAEELHRVRDDLDRLALRAVLRLPLAPVEASVDADRAPLREELRTALALVPPDRHVEVVGLVAPVALRVLLPRVHGDPQLADRRAARRVPKLGVARQVAHEDDAVDVGHLFLLLRTDVRL